MRPWLPPWNICDTDSIFGSAMDERDRADLRDWVRLLSHPFEQLQTVRTAHLGADKDKHRKSGRYAISQIPLCVGYRSDHSYRVDETDALEERGHRLNVGVAVFEQQERREHRGRP